MTTILAITEAKDNQLRKVSFEIVSEAARCAKELNAQVIALVIGSSVSGQAQELAKYGANKVIAVEDSRLANAYTGPETEIIKEIAKQTQAEYLFFPATLRGKSLSSLTAAHFETSTVSDCTETIIENGELKCKRPMYAGKAIATVQILKKPAIISLRPNVFPAEEAEDSSQTETGSVELNEDSFKAQITKVEKAKEEKPDLTEASIIVSGGRGMKGPENFHLIEELAAPLGGVTGASRAVVDAGWRPHRDQVGQTGKTVSPQLYIACGISGAIQHLAGMRTSKVIVAINKDPDAPIFQVADYGIVGDVFEVLPVMIEEAKKLSN